MNPDTHDHPHSADSPELHDALRWQLRALRQDHAPGTELWPGIAERLTARTAGVGAAPSLRSVGSTRPGRSRVPVALAASVLVAAGTLGLLRHGGPQADGPLQGARPFAGAADAMQRPNANAGSPGRHAGAGAPLALTEAEGLRLQYEGAIRELETRPGAAAPNPTLRTLDQSAALILAALRQAPDSTRLLEQLRRTYQRRLDLMRLPLA